MASDIIDSTPTRVLIAGIGNIFLGDDAFGVEVVQRLLQSSWPRGVRVVDFGIRGIDLTYALLDGCELAILIDAAPRGLELGTVYTIEPDLTDAADAPNLAAGFPLIEAHSLDPGKVLRLVTAMGGRVGKIILVGCEPTLFDPDQDIQGELSPAVRAAVEPAAELVRKLTLEFVEGQSAVSLSAPHADSGDRKELHHGTIY